MPRYHCIVFQMYNLEVEQLVGHNTVRVVAGVHRNSERFSSPCSIRR